MKDIRSLIIVALCTMYAFLFAGCTEPEAFDSESKIDKSELQAEIAAAEALISGTTAGEEPGQCPQIVYDKLKDAIDMAKEVYANENVSQEDVYNAVDALQIVEREFKKAIIPALPEINKKPLEYAINAAEKIMDEAAPGSDIEPFLIAIGEAKDVMNKTDVTQEELDAAEEAVYQAIKAFKASDPLVLYLPFDGEAIDMSSRQHSVEFRPAEGTTDKGYPVLTTDRHGEADKAYSFSGGFMSIPFSSEFTGNDMSIMYWQYQDEISPTDMVVISMQWWDCWLTKVINKWGNNTPSALLKDDVTKEDFIIETGRWYHIAFTRTDTEVSLYVDGKLVRSVPATGEINISNVNNPLRIGAMNEYPQNYLSFIGKLDEIRYYSKGLNADEIAEIYNMEK